MRSQPTRTLSEVSDSTARSASAQLDDSLSRIAAQEGKYHAVSQLFEQEARRNAAELDASVAQGAAPGKLHGVPFLVKELVDIEGHVTGFGSGSYASRHATATAPAIRRLQEAGATLLGTAQMVEFAFGSWGSNYLKGTPWNPCDPDMHRAPGGSSSGSAVAVAAGFVPVAIGSDTGGSIRIPASLCGVVGFKPSNGLIPTTGVAPLGPTFDTLGPIARHVVDARSFTEVMSGEDLSHPPVDVKGLRIAVLHPDALAPLDARIARAFEDTVAALESRGARVTQIDLPLSLVEFQKLNGDIVGYEAYARLEALVEDWRLPMDPHVRRRSLAFRDMDRLAYEARLAQLEDLRRGFKQSFAAHDVLALPGTPFCAPPLFEVDETEIPMSRYTRIANCMDMCAICLPLPRAEGELPIGFQLCASLGSDAYLLSLAETIFASW